MRASGVCILLAAVLAVLFLSPAGPAAADDNGIYFNVSDLGQMSLEGVVDGLDEARIVVIGEHHGNREHHRVQLAIIRALTEKGRKVAVGLEMFRGDAQIELNSWIAGESSLEDLFSLYIDNWVPDYWWLYADILVYAREKSIPLLGLNLPRSTIRAVATQGYNGISDELRGTIPAVRCEVSSTYRQFLAELTEMKANKNGSFVRFCEAQVLWDTVMAQRAVDFAMDSPDAIVVILAGHFHAWKHGIAAQVERISDVPVKVVLPSGDKSVLRYDIVLKDADYVWWEKEAPVQ